MSEFNLEFKALGILGKLLKFLFFSKVGRFILIGLIALNFCMNAGMRVTKYYIENYVSDSERVLANKPFIRLPQQKKKGKLTTTDSTLIKEKIAQDAVVKKAEIVGFSTVAGLMILIIILFFFVRRMIKRLNGSAPDKPLSKSKIEKLYNNDYAFVIPTTEKKEKIFISNPFRGIYIQGGAGSGKSESMIVPFIKQCAEKNYCGIIYDFKNPELIRYALHYYEGNENITVKIVDFKNPVNSARINPLNVNNSISKIVDLSQALFYNLSPESLKNKNFFVNEAINLFSGMFIYFKNNLPQYFDIPHVVSSLVYCDIRKVVEKAVEDNIARPYLSSIHQSIISKADPQLAGIFSTLIGNLAQICNADVFYILSGTDVDLNLNNPEKPTLLLLGNDSTAPEVFNPLIACIITACVRNMNEEGKHHSVIMMDEAPTIYVPKIEQIPATARSNKIVLMYACQDHSQNIAKYGNDNASTLLSNLGNQFYFRTINKNTAQLVSDLFDKQEVEFESRNTSKSSSTMRPDGSTSKGSTYATQERRRVKISDIINLNPGEFFALIADGNFKEVLRKKVKIESIQKPDIELKPLAMQIHINNTFEQIIEETKAIFE